MIDFHSHILPGVDDGSRNTAESIALLELLQKQGVRHVIATPHFYPDRESVDSFLRHRTAAWERLTAVLPEGLPQIHIGAEVKYYPGISRLPQLEQLCIQGTKLLLLEMPFTRWTEYTVKELLEMAGQGSVTVVLAHLERYLGYQSEDALYRLYEAGILIQCNASFFLGFTTKRKAVSMLRDGEIHFIGSDCHNLTARPPKMDEAAAYIRKKLGGDFLSRVWEYGYSALRIH